MEDKRKERKMLILGVLLHEQLSFQTCQLMRRVSILDIIFPAKRLLFLINVDNDALFEAFL